MGIRVRQPSGNVGAMGTLLAWVTGGLVVALLVAGLSCGGAPPDGDNTNAAEGSGPITLVVTVVDASDVSHPVQDAYVYVPIGGGRPQSSDARATDSLIAAGLTNREGRVRLVGLEATQQTVVVRPPSGSGYDRLEISIDLRGLGGAAINLQLTLVPSRLADEIADVVVDPPNSTVAPGGTLQYHATVFDRSGAVMDLTPVWFATNGVGAISKAGLFTAASAPGSGSIVAIVGGETGVTIVTVAETVNARPTVEVSVTPRSGLAPLTVTANAEASDEDGEIRLLGISWGDGSPELTVQAATFGDAPTHTYATPGDFTVRARAQDDLGAEDQSNAIATVQAKSPDSLDDPPELAVTPTTLAFGSAESSLSFGILNNGGGALAWTCATEQSWLSISPTGGSDTGTVTVTADRSAIPRGSYEGAVAVHSNAGDAMVTVTIDVGNHAPVIASLLASPPAVVSGHTATVTATATDLDSDPLTYAWSISAGQLSANGSTATWTAPSTKGSSVVTCTVSDGGESVSRGVTIIVTDDIGDMEVVVQ